ncbi:tripartite ATP-independent transporter DctM subunit [Stella humosa]|uniref:TRAP transporter large permease protein n=1 Tax=Stella humosa TaxID=94 RepID=A0A3N1LGW8_9PROT|nr:TRAP transporter large permease subunit [Stella humosa]ROP90757.1 tripartite ATP-independent transporter DctM subunit [Stella humosa]BBK34897.1 membrane protein [Stella humosa]
MSWELLAAIYFGLMLALLFGGVWIAISLGAAGVVGLWMVKPALLGGIESVVWNTVDSFVLTAVPLFLFMGAVILHSGISARFYRSLSVWLTGVPGGLAQANIAACAIFAALCGSSVATAAAVGAIAIPEMKKRGYGLRPITGTLAAGGTLGILIPPSIPFIIYGSTVGESVGKLFVAGIIPGVMMTAVFMLFLAVQARFSPDQLPPSSERASWRQRMAGLLDLVPVVGLILVVIGGIYVGIMTPTEAAGIGAAGAVVVAAIYGGLTLDVLRRSLLDALRTNAMILFIVIGAQILSFALVSAGIPRAIVSAINALDAAPYMVLLLVVVMYLILGCLVDALSLMLLTLPVVHPVMMAAGFDPIWFGVVLVLLLEVGLITPPVGVNLFVIQGMAGTTLGEVSWGAFPYVLLLLAGVLALTIFPDIALWLPRRLF